MDNINIKSQIFRQNLYNYISDSDLPVSNIYFIITLLQKQVELNYYASLNAEAPEEKMIPQTKEEEVIKTDSTNNLAEE